MYTGTLMIHSDHVSNLATTLEFTKDMMEDMAYGEAISYIVNNNMNHIKKSEVLKWLGMAGVARNMLSLLSNDGKIFMSTEHVSSTFVKMLQTHLDILTDEFTEASAFNLSLVKGETKGNPIDTTRLIDHIRSLNMIINSIIC